MVWCQQYRESLISALLQRRQQIKWFGVYSTAEVLSQPCCWESGRSNGLVSTVQWKSYLSPVAEKAADQMGWCLWHSRSLISALLLRKWQIKLFGVNSTVKVLSSVLLQRKQQIKWFGVYSTVKVLSSVLLQRRRQIKWFGVNSTVKVLSSVLLQRKRQMKRFGAYSTAEVMSEPSCREGDIWNGCVCAAQWRSDLSPLHRPQQINELLFLQHSRDHITALLYRQWQVKQSDLFTKAYVESNPCWRDGDRWNESDLFTKAYVVSNRCWQDGDRWNRWVSLAQLRSLLVLQHLLFNRWWQLLTLVHQPLQHSQQMTIISARNQQPSSWLSYQQENDLHLKGDPKWRTFTLKETPGDTKWP